MIQGVLLIAAGCVLFGAIVGYELGKRRYKSETQAVLRDLLATGYLDPAFLREAPESVILRAEMARSARGN